MAEPRPRQPTAARPAPSDHPGRRLLTAAAVAVATVALVVGSWPAGVRAATPVPRPPELANVQAWLDAEFIVPDAPTGGQLQAGVTFWDTAKHDFAPVDGVFARLRPKTGRAAAAIGTITADFPGHVVVDLVVPDGGPGTFQVGVHATGGDVILPISGTGPPPEAPLGDLLTASFHDVVGSIVADRAFPVSVDIGGRGLWDFSAITPPNPIYVLATRSGQPDLASGELLQTDGPGTPFSGHLTIPGIGQATLQAALKNADGTMRVLPGPATSVDVIEGGRPSASAAAGSPAPAASSDNGMPVLLGLALVAAVVLIVGSRLLAGRSRRDRYSGLR